MEACRISSVVSLSVARAEPSASRGSSPRVTRHCRAGASPVPSGRSSLSGRPSWNCPPWEAMGFHGLQATRGHMTHPRSADRGALHSLLPQAHPAHWMRAARREGAPEQDQVRESVVSTGTATVSTGMLGRYLATSRAVDPPRVSTTMRLACTCAQAPPRRASPPWTATCACTSRSPLVPRLSLVQQMPCEICSQASLATVANSALCASRTTTGS